MYKFCETKLCPVATKFLLFVLRACVLSSLARSGFWSYATSRHLYPGLIFDFFCFVFVSPESMDGVHVIAVVHQFNKVTCQENNQKKKEKKNCVCMYEAHFFY